MVEKHEVISIQRQCELLGLSRSTYYYEPQTESVENLKLMRLIDELYLEYPFYGSRKMTAVLQNQGFEVNGKRNLVKCFFCDGTGFLGVVNLGYKLRFELGIDCFQSLGVKKENDSFQFVSIFERF